MIAAVVAALVCLPSIGRAQSTLPTSGFDDGFFVQSPDGENRLVFGLVVQADGRFSTDDPALVTNTFLIRRMRPTLTGQFGRRFQFKVMPDFGGGTVVIQDAYLDLQVSPAFSFRAGKNKTPVGYELLIGDAYLVFPERSLASNLVPNRDVGFEALGELSGGRLTYAAGLFNGLPDGVGAGPDVDVNDGKDLAGRIAVHPFRGDTRMAALRGLGVHLGGSSAEMRRHCRRCTHRLERSGLRTVPESWRTDPGGVSRRRSSTITPALAASSSTCDRPSASPAMARPARCPTTAGTPRRR